MHGDVGPGAGHRAAVAEARQPDLRGPRKDVTHEVSDAVLEILETGWCLFMHEWGAPMCAFPRTVGRSHGRAQVRSLVTTRHQRHVRMLLWKRLTSLGLRRLTRVVGSPGFRVGDGTFLQVREPGMLSL